MRDSKYKALYELNSGLFIGWAELFIKRLYDPVGKNIGYFIENKAYFLCGRPMGEIVHNDYVGQLAGTHYLTGKAKIPAPNIDPDVIKETIRKLV